MNKELLNYIQQNLEQGKTKEQIWGDLRQAGWQEKRIKRAFQELGLLEMDVLPGIGDLLERIFQTYKDKFWTLVGIMLPLFLLGWLGWGIWWFLSLLGIIPKIFFDNIVPLLILICVGLIFLVVLIFAGLWAQVALVFAIKEKEIGIKEAFSKGWHKIISYWWISVLSIFLVWGGTFLFFIPGIILAIWFSLALYILIAEDKKGLNALFRSKQLVAGKWWTVFWRELLISLIVMGVSITISFIPLGENLASLITTPFVHIFGFLLYQDLRRFKKDPLFETPKTTTKLKFILMAIIGYLLLPIAIITIWLVF